eukprot:scaffold1885_cov402-Prasinococcus_capsulatus_cf.AAC.12
MWMYVGTSKLPPFPLDLGNHLAAWTEHTSPSPDYIGDISPPPSSRVESKGSPHAGGGADDDLTRWVGWGGPLRSAAWRPMLLPAQRALATGRRVRKGRLSSVPLARPTLRGSSTRARSALPLRPGRGRGRTGRTRAPVLG